MDKILLNKELLHKSKSNENVMNELVISEDAEKFIKYVIKTYTNSPVKFMLFNQVEFDDLMQLGRIGLFKGIKDSDLDKTTNELQRYFYLRILAELREVARSNSSNNIVISQRIRGMYSTYLKFHNDFFTKNYCDPSIKEVMLEFSINKEDAYDLVYGMQSTISDTVETKSGSINLMDILSVRYFDFTKSVEQKVINRLILEEKLSLLKNKERKVLELKYLFGYKNSEIARRLGCANSMINKHLNNAFKRLETS